MMKGKFKNKNISEKKNRKNTTLYLDDYNDYKLRKSWVVNNSLHIVLSISSYRVSTLK